MSKQLVRTLLIALVATSAGLAGCVGDGAGADEGELEQDVLPPPPTVTATPNGPNRMNVTWTTVPGAFKYYIYQNAAGGPFALKGSVLHPGASLAVAGLTPNTLYCYVISTVDSTGAGPTSSPPVCATTPTTAPVPQPPATVTANATSESRIRVDWSAVTNATKYYVYQALGTTGAYSQIQSVLAPTTTATAVNLQPNTTYCFKIQTESAGGQSVLSAPACATTFVFGLEGFWKLNEGTGTTAKDSSGNARPGTLVGVGWSTDRPNLDNDPFTISSSGMANTAVNVPDASVWWFTGSYTISIWAKVTAAPTGTVRIAGKRAANCGAIDWELSQDGAGLAFRTPTQTLSFGQSLVPGTWTQLAVTSNGTTATAYVNGQPVASGPVTVGPRSPDPLQFGNAGGCASAPVLVDEVQIYSRPLSASEVAAIGTPPAPPAGLTATASGAVHVTVTWSAVAGASKYLLYKGTAMGNETLYASLLSPTTSFTDAQNAPGSTSFWTVRSVRNGLISAFSTETSVTTGPAIAAPSTVTATVVSTSRVRVDWSAVAQAVKYYVWQSAGGGAPTLVGSVLSGNQLTFTSVNLTSGTTYCYQVQTVGPDSESTLSTPAQCVTP